MNKKHTLLGFILAIVTGTALLALLVTNAFLPHIILPRPTAGNIILLCLIALTLDYYIAHDRRHDFRFIPIYGALIFGLFPMAAFVAAPIESLRLALMGAVILTVLTYIFDTITERLSSSPAVKLAPLLSAFGLYLAAQCLIGII